MLKIRADLMVSKDKDGCVGSDQVREFTIEDKELDKWLKFSEHMGYQVLYSKKMMKGGN